MKYTRHHIDRIKEVNPVIELDLYKQKMGQIREAIANDCFLDFRKEFYSKYDMSRNF